MRYLIGLAMVGFGVILIIKTKWFVENFGTSAWAEEKMGTAGGTRLMYKLIGLGFIFFGMMVITNMIGGFLMATIGKLFMR